MIKENFLLSITLMMTGRKPTAASYTCTMVEKYKRYNPNQKLPYSLKATKWNMKWCYVTAVE